MPVQLKPDGVSVDVLDRTMGEWRQEAACDGSTQTLIRDDSYYSFDPERCFSHQRPLSEAPYRRIGSTMVKTSWSSAATMILRYGTLTKESTCMPYPFTVLVFLWQAA